MLTRSKHRAIVLYGEGEGTTICRLAIVNVSVIIILSIGNTQISTLLLCFLYLFVELMITMNEYNFLFKPKGRGMMGRWDKGLHDCVILSETQNGFFFFFSTRNSFVFLFFFFITIHLGSNTIPQIRGQCAISVYVI